MTTPTQTTKNPKKRAINRRNASQMAAKPFYCTYCESGILIKLETQGGRGWTGYQCSNCNSIAVKSKNRRKPDTVEDVVSALHHKLLLEYGFVKIPVSKHELMLIDFIIWTLEKNGEAIYPAWMDAFDYHKDILLEQASLS